MIIKIVSIGKVKSSFVKAGEEEYLKRMSGSPFKIERIEIDPGRISAAEIEKAKEKESRLVLERVKSGEFLAILDERGSEMTSAEFAKYLSRHMNQSRKTIIFAIGGAYGWHESMHARADFVFSLSQLTFPFQLARMLLVEQLYRAHTIISGAPYHKS